MNLAEIKAAAEAATPGPWVEASRISIPQVARGPGTSVLRFSFPHSDIDYDDAAFIALSREAVPWLVERVEELDRALRRSLPIMERPVFAAEDARDTIFAAASARAALGRLEGIAKEADPTEGLPPDLLRVLRDPTITIQRDHEIRLADGRTLFEHLEEWRKAPSNTASAELPEDSA